MGQKTRFSAYDPSTGGLDNRDDFLDRESLVMIADRAPNRRRFLRGMSMLGGLAAAFPSKANTFVDLDLPGGPSQRDSTTTFPQNGLMILQRSRPPPANLACTASPASISSTIHCRPKSLSSIWRYGAV